MLDVDITHDLGAFQLRASFTAPAGLTALFGRSGSGKTSIINAVAGLVAPCQGKIVVGERVLLDSGRKINLPTHRRGLGYIFQEGRLFPHLNVRQNLRYGSWFARKETPPPLPFDDVVSMLGLGHLLDRRPGALSGGEKQRVAIGRALLAAPRLILADEPLAALDEARKAEIMPYFERLRDHVNIPILYVSHSASEVARLATSVVAIADGRVIAQGNAVEVLGNPAILPMGARGAGAILLARVVAHHDDGLTELQAGGVPLFLPRVTHPPGSALRVRIAAHDVILATDRPTGLSALNIIPATVTELRKGDGPGVMVGLDTGAGRLLARITRRSAGEMGLAPGKGCHAVLKSVAIAPEDVGGGPL